MHIRKNQIKESLMRILAIPSSDFLLNFINYLSITKCPFTPSQTPTDEEVSGAKQWALPCHRDPQGRASTVTQILHSGSAFHTIVQLHPLLYASILGLGAKILKKTVMGLWPPSGNQGQGREGNRDKGEQSHVPSGNPCLISGLTPSLTFRL